MYEDENGTNKPKIYVPLAAILLALALLAILLGDLGGGEEWLAVLLVAEGGVLINKLKMVQTLAITFIKLCIYQRALRQQWKNSVE